MHGVVGNSTYQIGLNSMVMRVKDKKDKSTVLDLMEPLIARWFDEKFTHLTEPQGYAIPLIHDKQNVLVSSPTGSGKTLTAFLSIINELFKLDKKGELEEKIYCVYVSPLKALANDIHKNLEEPLEELKILAKEEGIKIPDIKTATRSGDTPQSERRKMVLHPPHILITTPESLALILSSPRFRKKFDDVQYFIMDEIHDICSSKRGSFLSLNVERLQAHVKCEMTRIGLSATQAPIEDIAGFLGGLDDGELRPVEIIEVVSEKRLDLSVISPVDDMTLLPYEVVNHRMYDMLKEMVDQHRTTLIFTNTRSGAENVSYKLQERGIEQIAAHHGSLSKETRLTVEDDLKDGELAAAVSSTSLELGIDVGHIDLVIQVGSPKSVAKGLQRVGRAGHGVGKTSKGRLIVFEKDDLVECAVLTREALHHNIDRVDIPENNLDVLAQTVVGMSIEQRWDVDEALKVIRNSYCYRDLTEKDYLAVLSYLGGYGKGGTYSKIWYSNEENVFGKKGGSQMIYYLNIGTIPSDSSYMVYSEKNVPLGNLSEKFVERLTSDDVFILGGHSYEFIHTRGTKVFVREASGKKPTVPSWSGEMLPRSYDLSRALGRFRRKLFKRLDNDRIPWLMDEYHIDRGSANTIMHYFEEQAAFSTDVPTDRCILVEGYVDQNEKYNLIFHACFGRRVNDTLSRAYAYRISSRYNCSTKVSVTDDNFLVSTSKKMKPEEVVGLVNSDNIESIIRRAVRNTEMFKQRFRHCAGRGFMILRNYKGRDISVSKQKMRSGKILEVLEGYPDHPIIKETYNEILYQVLDLKNAKEVLEDIKREDMKVSIKDYTDTPSPFAHNVVMIGISDVIMMEDRSALLRQFHQKVLERVIPKEEIERFMFDREVVDEHFFSKRPNFVNKEGMLDVIKEVGPVHVFKERGQNIYLYTDRPYEEVQNWGRELLNDGMICSIWMNDLKWVAARDMKSYLSCLDQGDMPHGSLPVLSCLEKGLKTKREIYEETELQMRDVERLLRELERKRLVNRRGITEEGDHRYGLLENVDLDMEALESVIMDYLEYNAPRGLEEISYALAIPDNRTLQALSMLLDQGKVVSGKLVVGEDKQFMLLEDYHHLRFPGKDQVSEKYIAEYLAEKNFKKFDNINDYFEVFGAVRSTYDLFLRVKDFSMDEWERMRTAGDILEGRFINGKVCMVLREAVPLYTGAYREESLTEEDRDILQLIESGKANTTRDLKKASHLSSEGLKEVLYKLDTNLYIYRGYTGEEGWSSTNLYRCVDDVEPLPREDAREGLVLQLLKADGPVSLSGLRYHTGFSRREVESILAKNVRDDVVKVVRVGTSQREMYIMADEFEDMLEATGTEVHKTRILSRRDPYARPMWADIYSRYGDDPVFPVVKDGRVVGGIEKWKMSGCIELRHIDLPDEKLLDPVLECIEDLMDYHRLQGYDIVRIRHFNHMLPEDLDDKILEKFHDSGYYIVENMLVKGNIVRDSFTHEELLSYVFQRQRLGGSKYKTPMDAVSAMKGIRSDMELRSRVKEFSSIKWLHKKGKVIVGKMIPPYKLFALPGDTAVYRQAKNVSLKRSMQTILDILRDKEPAPIRTIYYHSPFDKKRTKKIIDDLYNGLLISKDSDGRYVSVPYVDMDPYQAKTEVIKWAFHNFGVFTAEKLSFYLGSDFSMKEIREILAELVEQKYIVKGFLREDDDDVYWILADGLTEIGKVSLHENIVISPKDRLSLYIRNEILERFDLGTCYVVFSGTDMVAGFTATRRGKTLRVASFEGDESYRRTVKEWAYKHNLGIKHEGTKKRVSDYEVRKWYESTRGI